MEKHVVITFVKIKLLPFFLFAFLLAACGSKSGMSTPTNASKITIEPVGEDSTLTRQFYDHQCRLVGYENLAGFYPDIYYSPNRDLSFVLCEDYSDGKTYYPFIIARILGEQPGDINPIILPPDWITNFPSTTFKPDLWNHDALIFRAYTLPCPDQIFCFYQDGDALYNVNMESGEFSTLLSPQSLSYAFSISPDGKDSARYFL